MKGSGSYRRRGGVWAMTVAAVATVAGTAGCRQEPVPSPLPPPLVTVAAAVEQGSAEMLRMSGTIEAERSTALSFAVPGTIEAVLVQEGETVAAGQVLARVGSRSYTDALGIAKAKAEQAEDAYKRLEPMHRNRTVPDVKWVEVETGVRQARLTVSMAQKSVDDTVLRAPESGVIARRHAEPGQTAIPGTPAFMLVQTRTVFATAPVPETRVAGVRKGQRATVDVGALGRTFEGAVREVGVAANPLTRTYDVKIAVPNPGGALRVGMIADIHLQMSDGGNARGGQVAVPPEAVRIDERGATYVFVVAPDGKLQRRMVGVAQFVGESTALSSGIRAGERVVTSGTPMLYDGLTVRVADGLSEQVPR